MADLHIVFNFFEKLHKPPEQESFMDGMKFIYEYVRKQPSFLLGQLHKNIDPNGLFPAVNHVGFGNGDFDVFRGGKPSQEWIQVGEKGLGPRELRICYPGGYRELATLSGEPMVTKPPKDEQSMYLLINYKESDVGETHCVDFEANWKTATGAAILTEMLQGDVTHGDIGFYKRRPGKSITPFLYVLRCEILPGPSAEGVLQLLPTIREKFREAKIPLSNVSAYNICYLCTPKS